MDKQPTEISRRKFTGVLGSSAALAAVGSSQFVSPAIAAAEEKPAKTFRLWVTSDSHVGTDLRVKKKESLADAIRQSERGGDNGGPAFDWDIALHLGDFSGNQGSPKDEEGKEVVRQFGAMRKHTREQFYCLAGNHDASFAHEETQWWFKKWIDPAGESTEFSGVDAKNRPYPFDGTWERYRFKVGNLCFLMMSDRNDGGPPVGRDKKGGYPAGAVSGDTFAWWKEQLKAEENSVIISAHHHMLKETTVASGEWEGFKKKPNGDWQGDYHGYFKNGGPMGASYLYWVDGKPDAQAFEKHLAAQPGAIDFWLGAHTHTHPDDIVSGRTHVERKWDVNFVNCAALTCCHGHLSMPMSRLFTFTEGSQEVLVQCYLHTSKHGPEGWYAKSERKLGISQPFQMPA